MTEHTEQHDEQPAHRPLSPKAKSVFAVLLVLIVGFIIMRQRFLPEPKGWINNDLPKAQELARNEGRNLLILFVESPPSDRDRKLRRGTLGKGDNIRAVRDYNLVAVMVRVDRKNRQELMETYKLSRDALPALLILDPEGNELARDEGGIGETAFRDTFLKDALD